MIKIKGTLSASTPAMSAGTFVRVTVEPEMDWPDGFITISEAGKPVVTELETIYGILESTELNQDEAEELTAVIRSRARLP